MRIAHLAIFVSAMLIPLSVRAEELTFSWPVACTQGQDCWILNYVDSDPAPGVARDFNCGGMTYDGHDGTDIALRDHVAIDKNIAVLAAADGTVLRLRNNVPDHDGTAAALKNARSTKEECGNGVIIDHGNGWQTQYCHMKQGSLRVHPGEHVASGQALGSVGQTGLAAFAHLHFGVTHNKEKINPFTGRADTACGTAGLHPLWRQPVAYDALLPYAAGFTDQVPDIARLSDNSRSPTALPGNSDKLVFWMLFYGQKAGDHIDLTITGPDGKTYAESRNTAPADKIRALWYTGRKTNDTPLPAGVYTGAAVITRKEGEKTLERRIGWNVTIR